MTFSAPILVILISLALNDGQRYMDILNHSGRKVFKQSKHIGCDIARGGGSEYV